MKILICLVICLVVVCIFETIIICSAIDRLYEANKKADVATKALLDISNEIRNSVELAEIEES